MMGGELPTEPLKEEEREVWLETVNNVWADAKEFAKNDWMAKISE
jgi:gluconate kinase